MDGVNFELLDLCEQHLQEARESASLYREVTSYMTLLEDANTVNKVEEKNKMAAQSTKAHTKSALSALIQFIDSIIQSIKRAFENIFGAKKFTDAQNAVAFANKTKNNQKLTVINTQQIDDEYEAVSKAYTNFANEYVKNPTANSTIKLGDMLEHNIARLIPICNTMRNEIRNMKNNGASVKDIGQAAVFSLNAEAALRYATKDKQNAEKAYRDMVTNKDFMAKLEKMYGKEGSDEYVKKFNELTKPVSIGRMMARLTKSYSDTKSEAYISTVEDIIHRFSGQDVSGAANTVRVMTGDKQKGNENKLVKAAREMRTFSRMGKNITDSKAGQNAINSTLSRM